MTAHICYRFVNDDMTSHQDNKTKWKIGKWNRQKGEIKCCNNGLHASMTPLQSLSNIYGDRWFIAEYKGEIAKEDDKFCASEMRLVKEIPVRVMQLFAIRCAKRVLKFYKVKYPNDKRPALAIKAAEDFLDGKITKDAAYAAHAAADYSAAAHAAADYSAAAAAYSADAADYSAAAHAAARAAAYAAYAAAAYAAAADDAAAYAAARAAEKKWQNKELLRVIDEYAK